MKDMEKFWSLVNKQGRICEESIGPCWEWMGAKSKKGYGEMRWMGERWMVHRFTWSNHRNSRIPEGMQVCHACDNRLCCHPLHLFLGSPKDNSEDMVKKGRQQKGEKHSFAKLTEWHVRLFRRLAAMGISYIEMQKMFKFHWATIRDACMGTTWKSVATPVVGRKKARLTSQEVVHMRKLIGCGMSVSEVSASLGVNRSTAYYAITGRSWTPST